MEQPKPIGRGSGKSQIWGHLRHGYSLVRGARHKMEDFHVAEFRQVASHEVGLFAIFDGHPGCNVARYLQCNLFDNILNEVFSSRSFLLYAMRLALNGTVQTGFTYCVYFS
ncbi:hypothetical protein GOP47_0026918 [Adiantum capillus-veneris]|nr:hypothetical protein GOP47_0026918 [Adiantum capillus-veneris]